MLTILLRYFPLFGVILKFLMQIPTVPVEQGFVNVDQPGLAASLAASPQLRPVVGLLYPRIICSLFPFLLSYRKLTHFQWVVNESEHQGCCWPIPRRYRGRQVSNLVSLFSQDLLCLIKGPVTTYFSPRIFLLLRGAHLSGI